MIVLLVATAIALIASLIASRRKTGAALKRAATRFSHILPAFLGMLVLFAVTITLLPADLVGVLLGRESRAIGVLVLSLIHI